MLACLVACLLDALLCLLSSAGPQEDGAEQVDGGGYGLVLLLQRSSVHSDRQTD